MSNPSPLPHNKEQNWTDKEKAQLQKLYPVTDNDLIAEKMNRSVRSIRGQAFKLRLKKSERYWNKKDEIYLVKNWEVMSAQEIADKLGKTRWAVINKYRELTGKRNKLKSPNLFLK